jgi:shikimate kinase
MAVLHVTLVGPGGAGKSTVAALVAERLAIRCLDLDQCFADRLGNISDYIARFGYPTYARENVETYRAAVEDGPGARVVALSSGFMTYPDDMHPDYARLRAYVDRSPTTFVLLPSLDLEVCVAEIVRRQLLRPFARSAAREEAVIRERFPVYVSHSARKIDTMQPLPTIVDQIIDCTLRRLGHLSQRRSCAP